MTSRARLDELLDLVKGEFDNLSRETTRYKDDHHEYELKLNQQHQELTNISNTVYELEQAHRSMKEAYEREIMKLKQELEVRDRLLEQHSLQQQQVAAAQAHAQAHAHAQALQGSAYATPQQLPPPNLSTNSPSSTYNNNGNSNGQLNKPDIFNNNQTASNGTTNENNGKLAPIVPLTSNFPKNNATTANGSTLPPLTTNTNLSSIPAINSTTSNTNTPKNEIVSTAQNTNDKLSPSKKSDQVKNESSLSPSSAAPNTVNSNQADSSNKDNIKTEDSLVKRAQHNKPIPAFLRDFDAYASLPYKKQHNDYYLVYNPNIPKKVDVSLVHSFDHTSVVCCVSFSKDGKFLATGCNKLTQVFSVETGDLVARLNDESTASTNGSYDTDTGDLYIRSVCFSPDGKFLATGAEDKIIRIWDLATRTIVKYLKGHEQDIYSLDFFPDGKRLVSGSGDRTVRIWDVFNGQCSLTLSIEDGVTTVAVSPDGSLIAAGSLDRTVRVWDANKGYLVERLDSSNEFGNGHMDSVYSVTFTNQGKEIASGSLDRTIKLWTLKDLDKQPSSVSKSNCEVTYVGHKDFVLSVCCTPDDEFILSGSKDRGVIMWDKESGEPYIMLQGHRNSVISVSVSPVINSNGGYFATGSGDCKARIWKWERITELN